MNREDIIKMAREAGIKGPAPARQGFKMYANPQRLEAFAALVAAREREACAMEAEYEAARWPYAPECREPCEDIAKSIRARGEQ